MSEDDNRRPCGDCGGSGQRTEVSHITEDNRIITTTTTCGTCQGRCWV